MIASKLKAEDGGRNGKIYLQCRHVPATRVRETHEALADAHLKHRRVLHRTRKCRASGSR